MWFNTDGMNVNPKFQPSVLKIADDMKGAKIWSLFS